MVNLGFESAATAWKAQTKPLSYGFQLFVI